jgi:hypothetical protein
MHTYELSTASAAALPTNSSVGRVPRNSALIAAQGVWRAPEHHATSAHMDQIFVLLIDVAIRRPAHADVSAVNIMRSIEPQRSSR